MLSTSSKQPAHGETKEQERRIRARLKILKQRTRELENDLLMLVPNTEQVSISKKRRSEDDAQIILGSLLSLLPDVIIMEIISRAMLSEMPSWMASCRWINGLVDPNALAKRCALVHFPHLQLYSHLDDAIDFFKVLKDKLVTQYMT